MSEGRPEAANTLPKGAELVVGLMRGDKATFKLGYTFANALNAASDYEARFAEEAASPSLTIEGAILAAESAQALIREHIPSITDEIEDEEVDSPLWETTNERFGFMGYAGPKRECMCGKRIDGFYEYAEHLIEVLAP